ncbi:hypothetical protein MUP29_02585 [bacterium]|nr:hypothetical protein [bacterium]
MTTKYKNNIVRTSYFWGISGSVFLLGTYFLTLTLLNSFEYAFEEIKVLGIWIALLTAGFGIQTGLFVYVRGSLKARATAQATASIAITGGMSATAMVACCMHHITSFLPILGLSAASLFLSKYQSFFLAIGVASNLLGITVMLRLIQKQELYESGHGVLGRLLKFDMNRALAVNLLVGMTLATIILIRSI